MHRFVIVAALLLIAVSGCVSNDDRSPDNNNADTQSRSVNDKKIAKTRRPKAKPRPPGIRPAQIKAVWVDAWGPGFTTAGECDDLIQWCLAQGFNTLLVEVRRTGDAYFDSQLEPRGMIGESGRPISRDFDPLQYLVEEARDVHGLRVEAWVVANRIWVGTRAPRPSTPGHIVSSHPDWLLINRDGKTHAGEKPTWYTDPSNLGARQHLANVCSDIATRYRVDAIHLDYIRYPDHNWGFGKTSLASYRLDMKTSAFPATKSSSFIDWRANQVTKQVRRIRRVMRERAPAVELTVAALAWGKPPTGGYKKSAGYRSACQDWPRWSREDLTDITYVMHYRRESDANQSREFRAWMPILKDEIRSHDQLVIGLGSYLNSPSSVRRQLRLAMEAKTRGIAVFSYRNPSDATGRVSMKDLLGSN
ncbi:MAG: uncharacterized lipoprotein YddW (UPF0748 family) [Planctomycetota bacterium]|jgi:uncharacterized lipoprotein YddW (UPF0748 family)